MRLVEKSRALWAVLFTFFATFLAMTLASAPALAQGNSVITGTVRDASSKAPVADVVVTATSTALQGEQVVVTDRTGQYRIPQLPPGDYTLRLEKETYKPYARGGMSLRVGSTIRVNIDLLPEALKAEEIVVVGRAPTPHQGVHGGHQRPMDDRSARFTAHSPKICHIRAPVPRRRSIRPNSSSAGMS